MPADKTIDTVMMIIAGGLLTMGLVSALIGWISHGWDRVVNRSQVVGDEPEHQRSIATPQLNDEEPDEPAFVNADELVLNTDEIAAVARMIKHNAAAAKPSKSSTIYAGFGVSRGGSAVYRRASLIYDVLFGQPEPAIVTPFAGRSTRAKFSSDKAS